MNNEKREQQMMDAADAYVEESEEIYNIVEAITDFCAGWRAADNSRWIPVEKEMPPKEGKYMFRLSNGDMCYETYYPKLKLVANVTHWMEIRPPQGKEDKE